MTESRKRNDGIIKVIRAERFTPYALARKLDAKVILESSSFKKGRERYSLLLIREAFRVSQKSGKIFLHTKGGARDITGTQRDILEVLLRFSEQHPPLHQDLPRRDRLSLLRICLEVRHDQPCSESGPFRAA